MVYLNEVLGLSIARQCKELGFYLSNVSKLGIPKRCVRTGYSSVCIEIGKCSAMYSDRLYLNNVLGLGTAQQGNELGFYLSNVSKLGIPKRCVRTGYSSVCNESGKYSAM